MVFQWKILRKLYYFNDYQIHNQVRKIARRREVSTAGFVKFHQEDVRVSTAIVKITKNSRVESPVTDNICFRALVTRNYTN